MSTLHVKPHSVSHPSMPVSLLVSAGPSGGLFTRQPSASMPPPAERSSAGRRGARSRRFRQAGSRRARRLGRVVPRAPRLRAPESGLPSSIEANHYGVVGCPEVCEGMPNGSEELRPTTACPKDGELSQSRRWRRYPARNRTPPRTGTPTCPRAALLRAVWQAGFDPRGRWRPAVA